MRSILIAVFGLGLVLSGCRDVTRALEASPDSIGLDSIVKLGFEFSPRTLPANGTSQGEVTARIPGDARSRVVVFTTTRGVFVPAGAATLSVRAEQDSTQAGWLVARAILRADTIPGIAFVTAAIEGFQDSLSITLSPVSEPQGR